MAKIKKTPFVDQLDGFIAEALTMDDVGSYQFISKFFNEKWRKGDSRKALAQKISAVDYETIIPKGNYKAAFGILRNMGEHQRYLAPKFRNKKSDSSYYSDKGYGYFASIRKADAYNLAHPDFYDVKLNTFFQKIKLHALKDNNLQLAFSANQADVATISNLKFFDKDYANDQLDFYDRIIEKADQSTDKMLIAKCLIGQRNIILNKDFYIDDYQRSVVEDVKLNEVNKKLEDLQTEKKIIDQERYPQRFQRTDKRILCY